MSFTSNGLFLTFLVFIVTCSVYGDDEYVIFENQSTKDLNTCWKNGGYISNSYLRDASGNFETTYLAVKLKSNKSDMVAYNFGEQFETPEVFIDLKKTDETIFTTVRDGKTRVSHYEPNDQFVCQRILHYKCLHDIILNSTESLSLVNKWKCKEFYGDLIIRGLGKHRTKSTRLSLDFISVIEKIHGRLIISQVEAEATLDFKSLEKVGIRLKDKDSSSIEIMTNGLLGIKFPKLDLDLCNKEPPKNCVTIGRNRNYNSSDIPLQIQFQEMIVPETWSIDYSSPMEAFRLVISEEERKKIQSTQDLDDRGWGYELESWWHEGWDGIPVIHYVLGTILGLAVIVLIAVNVVMARKVERVDMKEIDQIDDKSIKSIREKENEEYFKVGENNKNDAMDDLGSA